MGNIKFTATDEGCAISDTSEECVAIVSGLLQLDESLLKRRFVERKIKVGTEYFWNTLCVLTIVFIHCKLSEVNFGYM